MSKVTRLHCDRCGAQTDKPHITQWAAIQAQRHSGTVVLGDDAWVDLCEACTDSMAAWFANPQQFRQLHDAAEATLLWFQPGPWTDALNDQWRSFTGDNTPTSKGLCDAIRAALARPEVSVP